MSVASRDDNFVTTLLAVSSVDGVTPVTLYANPTTHRLLVDLAGGGSGTVQTVAVATANGFAGTSDGNVSAPTLTLTTSVTGILKGNGTAISAVTIGSGLSYDGTTLSATGGGTGDVVGPASAVADSVAIYNGTTGKLIKDSATTIATTATVNTIVKRDASVNIYANNFFGTLDSTVSASGTTILTIASARTQNLTGALSQTFQLPVATTLPTSAIFTFNNNSSGSLIITNAGASTLYTVPAGGSVNSFCTDNSTSNGVWDFAAEAPSSVTWSSGVVGLVMNSVLTTSPSIGSGASSSTAPSFIPQRGASTTGFGGDGTNLYATIAGTAAVTISSTTVTVPAVNKVNITAPATSSTLTILNGKTLTANNTLTLAGTDSTVMTFPTTSKTIAANDGTNWTIASQAIGDLAVASSATAYSRLAAVAVGQVLVSAGTGIAPAYSATPLITSIDIGNADTTISRAAAGIIAVEGTILNGYATTATAAGTTVLTVTSAQTQFFTGSTTQTVTLPTTSVLAGQTYRIVNNSTGNVTVQSSGANTIQILGAGMSAIFTAIVTTPTTAANWSFALTSFTGQNIAQTASANAATVNLAYVTNSITNNSAATLTITLPTAGAIDGELRVVRVYDFSAVAQTITWVNTQNSTVTATATSNGSTTLPITVGFQYNGATSLWRCIAAS